MLKFEEALKIAFDIAHYVADKIDELEQEDWNKVVGKNVYGSKTRLVDKVAEEAAFYMIEQHDPPLNILSEERGLVNRGYDEVLILDPLDGTTNAIWGVPFYGISIAIGKNRLGDVYFGYVFNLVNSDEFYSYKGEGVYWNNVKVVPKKGSEMHSLSLGKHFNESSEKSKEFVINALNCGKLRALGAAALELALVSVGVLRYYFQPSERLRVVDIAAGALFVWENGGIVTNSKCESLKQLPISLDVRTSVFASLERGLLC